MFSVLSGMSLEQRLVAVNDTDYIVKHAFDDIDWRKANEYFATQRKKASDFLDKVLTQIESNNGK